MINILMAVMLSFVPPKKVHIVFFNDVPNRQEIMKKLQPGLGTLGLVIEGTISTDLPRSAYYKKRKRYKADTLLSYLRGFQNDYVLGVTTRDISSTVRGYSDWGIKGLGSPSRKTAVVSTYRLKNDDELIKVMLHELGHTRNLVHCSDSSCYMTESNDFWKQNHFCTNCKSKLK